MKRNELKELKKQDTKALKIKLLGLQGEIMDLTISKTTGKLANLRQIKTKRGEVAQVLTVIGQKELVEKLEQTNG